MIAEFKERVRAKGAEITYMTRGLHVVRCASEDQTYEVRDIAHQCKANYTKIDGSYITVTWVEA
jgi:hypothetical protein